MRVSPTGVSVDHLSYRLRLDPANGPELHNHYESLVQYFPTVGLFLHQRAAAAMSEFLRHFATTLAQDEHAVMVLDGAGWRTSHDLVIPSNVSLLRLPPYAPELNPVERVWLYLRQRHLSHWVHDDDRAVLDAVCAAWCQLTPERLSSLCNYPWIRQVSR